VKGNKTSLHCRNSHLSFRRKHFHTVLQVLKKSLTCAGFSWFWSVFNRNPSGFQWFSIFYGCRVLKQAGTREHCPHYASSTGVVFVLRFLRSYRIITSGHHDPSHHVQSQSVNKTRRASGKPEIRKQKSLAPARITGQGTLTALRGNNAGRDGFRCMFGRKVNKNMYSFIKISTVI
jgi:hypothetical protein